MKNNISSRLKRCCLEKGIELSEVYEKIESALLKIINDNHGLESFNYEILIFKMTFKFRIHKVSEGFYSVELLDFGYWIKK